jgi:two-component system, NtrC family, response regulator AtoC
VITRSGSFHILVVDDEPEIVRDLGDLLRDEGYEVTTAGNGTEALAALTNSSFDLMLCDLRMPPPDGMALLLWLKEHQPDTPMIVLTAHSDPTLARQAIQGGALDYVTKPWNTFELLLRIRRVRERWDLIGQRERLLRWIEHLNAEPILSAGLPQVIGAGAGMTQILDLVRRVAPSEAIVLLRGESGTGKSLLAAVIHQLSPRREGPYLKINCGAIPEHLLESELFGHEKGAFTGAIRQKPGLFEVAEGGSLLLDEIGDVSPALQVKLLQVVEERQFLRVGGTTPLYCNVRILAATHQNLEEAITRGDFRADLYYRLNVFPILIPPLRERREDILPLVEQFLKDRGLDPSRVSDSALNTLMRYSFPGNIRELENLIERALILAGDHVLTEEHFPSLTTPNAMRPQQIPTIPDEGLSLEEVEKSLILASLEKSGGNKSKAAQLLGMTRRTLYSRMERHGIPI